jgi:hypothetical protein
VTDYRLYVIGIDGQFIRSIHLDCPNDGAAIESAKQFLDGHDIEPWHGERRVAKFDTKGE